MEDEKEGGREQERVTRKMQMKGLIFVYYCYTDECAAHTRNAQLGELASRSERESEASLSSVAAGWARLQFASFHR